MQWTQDDELKLLITIIQTNNVKPAWEKVAETMGEGFSAEAVRQHFSKIKKSGGKTVNKAATATNVEKSPKKAVRSRKRHRSDDSEESYSPKEPFKPKRLFQGPQHLGTTTSGMSSLKVASPQKKAKKAPLGENLELPQKALTEEDAAESGDDEASN